MVAEHGWIDVADLEALTGERRAPTLGRWVGGPQQLEELLARLEVQIEGAGGLGLDVAALSERERAGLDRVDGVVVTAGRARLVAKHDPLSDHPFVAALLGGWFAPPGADGVDRAELRALIQRGLVVERDGVWFHRDAIDAATLVASELLAASPAGFTVAEFRDAVLASRKHALPLVAELDARGVTRRRGDMRIAGPRLPPVVLGVE